MDSKKEFNIEDLLTGFETMKISALRNAAKLSPLIKECTLGPSCVDLSQKTPAQLACVTAVINADAEAAKENNVNGSNESTPPRNGRSVKEVEKKSPTSSPFAGCIQSESTSCAAVTTKLHQEDLERQRQACVQKVLAERQSKIQLADKQREAQLRQSLQEAKLAVARRMQESEQRILNAVREQEQIAQEAGTRRLAEIEQENRRQSDIQAQLKRRQEDLKRKAQLIDAIRQHNAQFRSGTETFTKALTAIGVQHASKFNNQKKSIRSLQKDFEQLLQTINANHEVTQAEIDQAGEYCKQLDQVNVEVSEIILQIEASQKQQQEQLQQQQLEQQQQQQQKQEQAAQEAATQRDAASKVPDSTDGVVSAPVSLPSTLPAADDSEPIFWPVSPECLQFYNEIKSFYEQHQAAVKQLMDDPSMKTYRFNCQKAINVPVNAISGVSREHLIDKYERLAALLSGQNVKVGDATVSINGHPLGRTYCTMLMAKKFVGQGDQSISSNAAAAFPIATVIVGLWQQFPDFGRFFLAYLHRECPYLVPYYLPQHEGQSQEDYLKSLGYRFAEGGQLEKQDQYLKRMAGLARLYAAVIVTIPRIDPSKPHPHGLENGWRWLTNILNRYPKADICATLIVEFLQTTGAFLSMTYRSQFTKLIQLLQGDYLSALSRIDQGGPKARLEGLIAQVVRDGKFDTPEGMSSLQFM